MMAVGEKRSDDMDVIPLSCAADPSQLEHWSKKLSEQLSLYEGRVRGAWRLRRWLQMYAGYPPNWLEAMLGMENFNFPETWKLLTIAKIRPDILHCHNLHGGWLPRGGYFDLRALPWLSQQVPTVVTLHDTWMLSGHCAYTLGCDRWKTGCGECPDLSIYPPIMRDATAFNWKRKRNIYASGPVYVSTPSRWLMRQVEHSMLAPGVVQSRVIPNGIDRSVFHPFAKAQAREELGLSNRDAVLLFVASGARTNMFKDYRTVEDCAIKVGVLYPHANVTLIVLGDHGDPIRFGNGEVRFGAFVNDRGTMARYYQAADVYVHAAKSDTFPTTILEALSCGLPVVATAVDGIPEQIEDGRCGYLVPPGDADAMAERVVQILSSDALRISLSLSAADRVAQFYTMERQVQTYLEWYEEILALSTSQQLSSHAS